MSKSYFPLVTTLLVFCFCYTSCKSEPKAPVFVVKEQQQLREIQKAIIAPTIDGSATDSAWTDKEWYPLDQRWLGEKYDSLDFSGRYKMTWTPEGLYLLAEITDDILFDQYDDPVKLWWDDDCLEIFIDEDNSGGEHQYNYNAFAYHVALDGNVIDMAPDQEPGYYNDHVDSAHKTTGNTTIWETKITVYTAAYTDGAVNDAVILKAGKIIGFALAYCDNDASVERENFIGSIAVEGKDKNRGWIDAGIFGTIKLID